MVIFRSIRPEPWPGMIGLSKAISRSVQIRSIFIQNGETARFSNIKPPIKRVVNISFINRNVAQKFVTKTDMRTVENIVRFRRFY